MHTHQLIVFGVIAVLVVALMGWRVNRMMTATPFDPYRAWRLPLLFAGYLVWSIEKAWPLTVMDWTWLVAAILIGAGFGWLRGRSITMTYEPVSRRIFARGGIMAVIFILALIVVRFSVVLYLHTHKIGDLRTVEVDAMSAALGAGLFIARSVELGLRGHKLLVANQGVMPATATEAP